MKGIIAGGCRKVYKESGNFFASLHLESWLLISSAHGVVDRSPVKTWETKLSFGSKVLFVFIGGKT